MNPFLQIVVALNEANVRYAVVGGWAVVLHGHSRLTVDVDIIVALDEPNASAAVNALSDLGLSPRIPVNAQEFANEESRRDWIENKGMIAFTMIDIRNPFFTVDLFVNSPVNVDDLLERVKLIELDGVKIPVCSLGDLIALKQISNRQVDKSDIEALHKLNGDG